jgi:hypothetical protein
MSYLITLEQLPIIAQRLLDMHGDICATSDYIMAMEVTEDSYKEAKRERARMNAAFDELERQRIDLKKRIMSVYDEFVAGPYKENVTDIWLPAKAEIDAKIKAVEDGLRGQRRAKVQEYFDELCQAHGIDFVTLDEVCKVGLSDSVKSLQGKVYSYIMTICEALETISLQEHAAEILVEFKRHKRLAQAISDVAKRHEAIAEEQRRAAERVEEDARADEAVARVGQAAAECPEVLMPPVAEETIEIMVVSLEIRHTREKMKELKQFLINGGYDYVAK